MKLPIPFGLTVRDNQLSPVVLDLKNLNNILVTGLPGYGKTNWIRSVIYALLKNPAKKEIYIYDFRYLEFLDFAKQDNVTLSSTVEELRALLTSIIEEIKRRYEYLKKLELVNAEKTDMPYLILIINALNYVSEDKISQSLLTQIVTLSRAVRIKCIIEIERPTASTMGVGFRNNIDTVLAFRLREISQQILFGKEQEHLNYTEVVGRAYLEQPISSELIEVQTMYKPYNI
jgi:DNA segregation ATPase FtsK/SpoIIIE-like protein